MKKEKILRNPTTEAETKENGPREDPNVSIVCKLAKDMIVEEEPSKRWRSRGSSNENSKTATTDRTESDLSTVWTTVIGRITTLADDISTPSMTHTKRNRETRSRCRCIGIYE